MCEASNRVNSAEPLLLGIDLGTSSCKAVLFDSRGTELSSFSCAYPLYRNGTRAEQDAQDYVSAVLSCLAQMPKEHKRRVCGVGITGQIPTDIFLGVDGKPTCMAMTWQDTRADVQAKVLLAHFGKERLYRLLGPSLSISANSSAAKYLWMAENEPDLLKKCRRVLMPKDYIGWWLTGEDCSDAWSFKTTCCVESGRISEEILDRVGLRFDQHPTLLPPTAIRGTLTGAAAEQTELPEGIPVSVGCGDGLAVMFGSGVCGEEGIAFNSAGTSEMVGMTVRRPYAEDALRYVPAGITADLPILYGPTQSGGASLLWLWRDILKQKGLQEAFAQAATVAAGSDGLIFMPYLAGERAPLWDSKLRGAFFGLTHDHTDAHMARAVMEGVGFSLRHCLQVAEQATGCYPHVMRMTGGGSQSDLWVQIKADICGIPVERLACRDACALGAAMTAAVGIGMYADLLQAAGQMVRIRSRVLPLEENRKIYQKLLDQYLVASDALRVLSAMQ